MNFEKTKQEILNRVGQGISKEGFLLNKKEETFERTVLENTDCFYFYFVNYGRRVFVEPLWGITNGSIDTIYRQVTERDINYYSKAFVLYNNLGQLKEYLASGDMVPKIDTEKHLIENEKDIDKVVSAILHDFKAYLLPYFDKHHSLDSFDRALNSSNLRDLIVHNSTYPERAIMGLVAAKLSKSPFYHELDAVYENELRDASPESKREYEKVKVLLSSLPAR